MQTYQFNRKLQMDLRYPYLYYYNIRYSIYAYKSLYTRSRNCVALLERTEYALLLHARRRLYWEPRMEH
jgi:hypothetical protein